MIRRRAFVLGLGAVLAAPLGAEPQQAGKVYRLALLSLTPMPNLKEMVPGVSRISVLATASYSGPRAWGVAQTAAARLGLSVRRFVVDFAASKRLPAMHQFSEAVHAGGLISYSTALPDLFRRIGSYVDRILRGAEPADLPVEQPTKFELVINLRTAKALGVTIAPAVLQRADQVIE